ncbi:hypothetical protein BDV27DRAFT_81675 [Aspergillus caelatus]|uniref:Uncharacterized protein n=1 Tax=Aspergillus caelatus TaxID=61420 RepID=A0A5N6ZJA0_9EURO|nr:uncharacterized protein BDV27DRAFT_81675 [Aspergillus caelatus]KAE8357704.1 hypothetical protein BDV27DRAFT_81675 [Aspergillus caelatus]
MDRELHHPHAGGERSQRINVGPAGPRRCVGACGTLQEPRSGVYYNPSKAKSPLEVLSFLNHFRSQDADTPLVVVPTSYGSITDQELHQARVNVVIYANHLMRAKFTAVDALSTFLLATR